MTSLRVAAVQASYVLMDQAATLDRVASLTAEAAAQGAKLVAFPEVFVPGTPVWIDTRPIWDGDEDWFRLLAENAVVVPGPATERLGAIARDNGVWLVIGVEEREQHGGTIYNTVLYLSPDGTVADRHRTQVTSLHEVALTAPERSYARTPAPTLLPESDICPPYCWRYLLAAQELAQVPGSVQHAPFPGAETDLALSKLKIDDDLGHPRRVPAGELVQVDLVPARPACGLLAPTHGLNLPVRRTSPSAG
jgi:hypothetical protein